MYFTYLFNNLIQVTFYNVKLLLSILLPTSDPPVTQWANATPCCIPPWTYATMKIFVIKTT